MVTGGIGISPPGVTCGVIFIDGGKSEMHPEMQSVRKIEIKMNMIPLSIAIPIPHEVIFYKMDKNIYICSHH